MENDYSNLIKQDNNGVYCILFQNKERLTTEEIESIFSKFGKIYNIKSTGDERGYRFIRYKYFYEVQNAVEGLQNHPKIKLAQHRKKNNSPSTDSKSFNENTQNSDNPFDNESFFQNRSNRNSVKNDEFEENTSQLELNTEKRNIQRSIDNDNVSVSSSHSLKTNNQSSLPRSLPSTTVRPNLSKLIIKSNDQVIEYSDKSSQHRGQNDFVDLQNEIPQLITSKGKVLSENDTPKTIIFNAEEIVVGNIHPNFGAPYILHLFDLFEPIAVSNVNVITETGIRYCRVYFKSVQDSYGAESLFDNVNLSGQKLIVLRTNRLMK